MTAVEIEGVSLSFRTGRDERLQVLDGIDLTVESGEFVALIGPSGCGKSTLLNVVAGLVSPDRGVVRVDGKAVRADRGVRPAKVGFVFQQPRLLNWRTVEENLAIALDASDVPAGEREQRIPMILETVGLQDFRSAHPLQLSGGMRSRVGLARALVVDPRLILMDEPLGALDAITARKVRDDLARICRESGATVMYVTHSIAEATWLADRVIMMYDRPTSIHRIQEVIAPRPRSHGDLELAELATQLEEEFFAHVVRQDRSPITALETA